MLKKVSFVILAVVLASVYESFQGQAQPILAAPTVEEAVAADQARDEQMAVMVELPCVISRFPSSFLHTVIAASTTSSDVILS